MASDPVPGDKLTVSQSGVSFGHTAKISLNTIAKHFDVGGALVIYQRRLGEVVEAASPSDLAVY